MHSCISHFCTNCLHEIAMHHFVPYWLMHRLHLQCTALYWNGLQAHCLIPTDALPQQIALCRSLHCAKLHCIMLCLVTDAQDASLYNALYNCMIVQCNYTMHCIMQCGLLTDARDASLYNTVQCLVFSCWTVYNAVQCSAVYNAVWLIDWCTRCICTPRVWILVLHH